MNALVVGHGRMGRFHANVLRDLGYHVTTVDPDPNAQADHPTIAEAWLCNPGRFDVAAIATPIRHLADTARKAAYLAHGLLIEKPMASTSQEARQLAHDLQRRDVCVGYTERFNPIVRQLTPGQHRVAHFTRHNTRPSPNRALDLLVHDIDLAIHLEVDDASFDTQDNQPNTVRRIDLTDHNGQQTTADLTAHTQSPLHAIWHAFLTRQPVPTMDEAVRVLELAEQHTTQPAHDEAGLDQAA